jgi:N4-gp56 family major capsid protein
MANTNLNNLVNPEVMADMISAELPSKIRFAPLAKLDTTLQGQPGNTITIPKYAYIGDAADVAEGVAMGTTVLSTSTQQAQVKKIGKAVELSVEAINSGYGDPVGQANKQLVDAIASKVDADLVDALNGATLTYDGSAGKISYAGIVNALAKFAEEDEAPKYFFIHPEQRPAIQTDSNFIQGNLGSVVSGAIGQVAGATIVVSNRVPKGASDFTNFIVKEGALAIFLKQDVQVETDKDILAGTVVVAATEHYVAALVDESKAVKATFAI